MELIVRFTLNDQQDESQFAIVEQDDELYLFSEKDDLKIQLRNNNGLLEFIELPNFSESNELVQERLIGLSANFLESRSQGFESENTFVDTEIGKPGYGPDDIFVENKPFSLKQIVDLIKDGDIELSPNFQRNFVWDKTRQSKLIESIFLGLPLPSIYLSQYEDGRLTIVDGLQRLTTIKNFFENKLRLSNLEYLIECNGKTFSELPDSLSQLRIRKFGQTQIMCFVIDYRSPSKLKFDLFRRLNTGGKPLNNQEIRNCLSKPELQELLKEAASSDIFKQATGGSIKDVRMEAQESVLRFLYFYNLFRKDGLNSISNFALYSGNMDESLDEFIDILNKQNIEEIKLSIREFELSLQKSFYLFERYAFRKFIVSSSVTHRKPPINKLLMLAFTILLTKYDLEDTRKVSNNPRKNTEILADLIYSDKDLFSLLTWSTNAKNNIIQTFKIIDSKYLSKLFKND